MNGKDNVPQAIAVISRFHYVCPISTDISNVIHAIDLMKYVFKPHSH
jgi:hypothetical protein